MCAGATPADPYRNICSGIQSRLLVAQPVLMVVIDPSRIAAAAVEEFLQPLVLNALDQCPVFLSSTGVVYTENATCARCKSRRKARTKTK